MQRRRTAEEAAARIGEARLAVLSVERDTLRRRPLPPFTTATLQQEALQRLGFGIGETMDIAQRLYEGVDLGGETAGLITYMRTDSTAMAKTAVAQARAVARKRFGDAYVPAKPRVHRARDRQGGTPRLAREAHEAIRPTDFARSPEALAGRLDRAAVQLYGLIRNRALASQMAAARFDRVRVEIAPEGTDTGGIGLAAGGERMVFDGHLRVWGEDGAPDTGGDGPGLPAVEEGIPVIGGRGAGGAPCHAAAAALHRGGAGAPAGRARHRPAVDLGGDRRRAAGARLRDPARPALRAHRTRPGRDRVPGGVLRRLGGDRLHGGDGGRPRPHRRRRARLAGDAGGVLGRLSRGARERPARWSGRRC